MTNKVNGKRLYISIVIISLLSISGALQAQQSDFLIQDYVPEKFEDIQLRLNGSTTLQGGKDEYNNSLYSYQVGSDVNYIRDDRRREAYLSGYFRYRYETVPKYLNALLNIRGNYYSHDNENSNNSQIGSTRSSFTQTKTKYGYNSLTLRPYVDAGIYITDNLLLSTLSSLEFRYTDYLADDRDSYREYISPGTPGYVERNIDDNKYRTDRDSKSYSFDINFLPGYGHVYEGKFASTAIYIIEELKGLNLLSRKPTDNEMSRLSELLYQAKSEHYFDTRLHDIETIETISEYLESKGIINASGSRTTLAINDVWKYFPTYDRQFGFKFRVGLGMMYEHETRNDNTRNTYYDFDTEYHPDSADVVDTLLNSTSSYSVNDKEIIVLKYPYATAMFDYYRPVNHKWQLNLSALLRYYFNASEVEEDSTHNIGNDSYTLYDREIEFDDAFKFNLSGSAIYILNSRTSGTLAGGFGYGHFKQTMTRNETVHEFDTFIDWNYFADLSIAYRISIPVTLTISATYDSGREIESVMGAYEDYNSSGYYIRTYLTYNIL
ncbi:MAG: hypothetical protein GY839_20050 [candidate division Zixibacteria bacterium]|nr:hypothetical protein [candidate division Zixibacteria bacterium]